MCAFSFDVVQNKLEALAAPRGWLKGGRAAEAARAIARDRIQSGLSVAVFPVETAVTGGTVHTLRFADSQRRPVFCLDPEELRAHSTPAFHEEIAKIVRGEDSPIAACIPPPESV